MPRHEADAQIEARAEIEAQYLDARKRFRDSPDLALKALLEQLAIAAERHASEPEKRAGVLIALEVIVGFCLAKNSKKAAWMFLQLSDQLRNLDSGDKSGPLVSSPFKKFGNRPREASQIVRVKLLALACVERLRSIQDPISAKDAQSTVASWANARPEFERMCSAGTLRTWQNTIWRDSQYDHMRSAFREALRRWETRDEIKRAFEMFGKPPS